MLLSVYILIFIIAFFLMFFSFLRWYDKKEIYLFFFISALFFFLIGYYSYNIEVNYCGLTTGDEWSCHLESIMDKGLSLFGTGFGILMLAMGILFTFTSIPNMLR